MNFNRNPNNRHTKAMSLHNYGVDKHTIYLGRKTYKLYTIKLAGLKKQRLYLNTWK